ncbi:hypothetical protein [Saccharolobus shibatae]|uniref:Uncharacterized protein n=1 Tax=Saccharolobus shibatae TaxID=2286 RepID=A0A8F5BW92_9CREN|nr:hypothetical protein [Saccharolobus shibatae]QXJ32631.1 hypothetical protein J5U21_02282 [Saccharolobus shibatae]
MWIPIIGKSKESSNESWSQVAKRSVAVIGYRSAGKTTFIGLLAVHIDYLASYDSGIKYRFIPGVNNFPYLLWSDILSMIREGRPLPPTEVTKAPYIGRLVVKYPKLLGNGELNIPIIDLAGELYQPIMDFIFDSKSKDFDYQKWNDSLRQRLESLGVTKEDLQLIYEFIFKAKAYLITINLEHALSSISASQNVKSNNYDATKSLLGRYFNVVTNLVNYRIERKDPPHVGIVLTHYDKVSDYIEGKLGYYVFEDYNYRIRLMNYIESTILNQLRNLRENVPIFISFYKPQSRLEEADNRTGVRLPDYPKQEYDNIFEWIKEALK